MKTKMLIGISSVMLLCGVLSGSTPKNSSLSDINSERGVFTTYGILTESKGYYVLKDKKGKRKILGNCPFLTSCEGYGKAKLESKKGELTLISFSPIRENRVVKINRDAYVLSSGKEVSRSKETIKINGELYISN